MKNPTTLVLCCLLYACGGTQPPSMPSYFEVVHQFFTHYTYDIRGGNSLIMARRRDGWHLVQLSREKPDEVVNDQLYWSASSEKWQSLKEYAPTSSDNGSWMEISFIQAVNNQYDSYSYNRVPYFGYEGWYKDVLKDFGGKEWKNDTLVEGVARAYSAAATAALHGVFQKRTNGSDAAERDRLLPPADGVIKTALENWEQSIRENKKIAARNPDYQTKIGPIGTKLFSESYNVVMQMKIAQRPAEAKAALEKCMLPTDDSLAACNMLQSADPQSILFTYGDVDTYPLLYLQERRKIRTDVTVINTSLLNLAPYIHLLKLSGAASFTTGPEQYGQPDFDFGLLTNNSTVSMPVSAFLEAYNHGQKTASATGNVRTYPTSHVSIQITGPGGMKDSLPLKLNTYVTSGEVILLDIVQQNIGQRRIFFSRKQTEYLDKYLIQKGLVYALVPSTQLSPSEPVIAQATGEYLGTVYKAPFNHLPPHPAQVVNYLYEHLNLYKTVVNQEMQAGHTETARTLLKECFAPFKRKPYLVNIDEFALLAYKLQEPALGEALIKTFTEVILFQSQRKDPVVYIETSYAIERVNRLQNMLAQNGFPPSNAVTSALKTLEAQQNR